MRAFSKTTGEEIVGTLDMIPARSGIAEDSFKPGSKGAAQFRWARGSEVFWDGQATVVREGQRVFLTESGEEVLEGDIELREDDISCPREGEGA